MARLPNRIWTYHLYIQRWSSIIKVLQVIWTSWTSVGALHHTYNQLVYNQPPYLLHCLQSSTNKSLQSTVPLAAPEFWRHVWLQNKDLEYHYTFICVVVLPPHLHPKVGFQLQRLFSVRTWLSTIASNLLRCTAELVSANLWGGYPHLPLTFLRQIFSCF